MENVLLELINALDGECPACGALVIGQGGHKPHCRVIKALRDLDSQKQDGIYCKHCGELLSEHLVTERGGYCHPSNK